MSTATQQPPTQASRPVEQPIVLDWPYQVPTALVQRMADVAAIERVESSPYNWMPYQETRLALLIDHVLAHNPWWSEWLGNREVVNILEHWRDVPVLQRAQLRSSIEATPSPKLQDGETPPEPCATRGTTGEPIQMLRSNKASRLSAHQFHADHFRHGRPLAVVRAVLGDVAQGHSGEQTWMPAVGELNESVLLLRNANQFSMAQHLDWLRAATMGQLTLSTEFLTELVDAARLERLAAAALPPEQAKPAIAVAQILTAGAALPTAVREGARQYLGAEVYDRYVCEEVGILATQARNCTGEGATVAYNVAMSHVLLEVLDAQGKPVNDGEVGNVVVTALHQTAHPVIRYALGDVARWHAKCPVTGVLLPSLTDIRRAPVAA
jgi:phenylacetate-CoA ligase